MDKVKPGQKFSVRADDWNALADVVNGQRTKSGGSGTIGISDSRTVTIDVLNTSDLTIPQYGICEISRFDMAQMAMPDNMTYQQPVWKADKPLKANADMAVYGIAQDYIQPDCVGKVCIAGCTIVMTSASQYMQYDPLTYCLVPVFSDDAPFNAMFTQAWSPIRVWGYVRNNRWQFNVFAYIEPFLRDEAIPAVIESNSTTNDKGMYYVRLYHGGYDKPYTGYAYMYLPVNSYGGRLPAGAKLMVYRRLLHTAQGTYDDGEGTP